MHASRRTLLLVVALLLPGGVATSLLAEEPQPETTPAFWLTKAEGLAKRIEHPEGRAALLVSIGTGWVEAGENERAKPLLASAVKYGRRCRGCISKARRLAEVGLLQHRAGDAEGAATTFVFAREACSELDGAARIQAQAYLAQQWHAAGGVQEAQGLLAKATKDAGLLEDFERAEALAAVADAESLSGDPEASARVREQLARAVEALGPDAVPILAGSQLTAAVAAIVAGRLDEAGRVLAQVGDPALAASGYVSLAREAFEAKQAGVVAALEHAMALAPTVSDPVMRAVEYAEIARTAWVVGAAEVGRAARAALDEACQGIEPDGERFHVQLVALTRFREAEDAELLGRMLARLEQSIETIDVEDAARDRLRGSLAVRQVRAGHPAQAEEQVGRIKNPVRQARARLDVADALRGAGRESEALERVAAVLAQVGAWTADRASDRDELLRQAAVLQAACGQTGEAVKTVDAIVSPFHAATACTYVARDLREAGAGSDSR